MLFFLFKIKKSSIKYRTFFSSIFACKRYPDGSTTEPSSNRSSCGVQFITRTPFFNFLTFSSLILFHLLTFYDGQHGSCTHTVLRTAIFHSSFSQTVCCTLPLHRIGVKTTLPGCGCLSSALSYKTTQATSSYNSLLITHKVQVAPKKLVGYPHPFSRQRATSTLTLSGRKHFAALCDPCYHWPSLILFTDLNRKITGSQRAVAY